MKTKELKPIIDELEQDIKEACSNNPLGYDGYVENCLLSEPESGAQYYDITVDQYKYCVNRALIRL